jgi:hypothetical protein
MKVVFQTMTREKAEQLNTSKAWYKEPWLLFLIALPLLVVIASINLVFISFDNADSVVADDYYKEGLAINQKIDSLNLAKQLGISIKLTIHNDIIEAEISPKQANNIAILNLALRHPMDHRLDKTITLSRNQQGTFTGTLPTLSQGSWHIDISPLHAEQAWHIKQRVSLPQQTIILSANGQ